MTDSIDWDSLTQAEAKADLYGVDTSFREGWDVGVRTFGSRRDEILWDAALMVVKPDCLVTGHLGVVRQVLRASGFHLVGAEEIWFTRHMHRELWRYQHTLATPDRLAVEDLVLGSGPSLLLLLRRAGHHDVPATVDLSARKGGATVGDRRGDSLRDVLPRPNQLFSMVHSADEPADLLRELSLLVEPAPRRRLLAQFVAGQPSSADEALLDRIQHATEHGGPDLDLDRARDRIDAAVRERAAQRPDLAGPAERICAWLQGTTRGEPLPWHDLSLDLAGLEPEVDVWDLALVGSTFVVGDVPGASKMIGKSTVDSWRARGRTGG